MNKAKLITLCILLIPLSAYAKPSIFTCEPEWAALAREIGGDLVNVSSATQAMQDPHFIQARPSLIAQLRKADLLVCTGAGLEAGWLPVLQRKSANQRVSPGGPGYLMATDYVTMKEVPEIVDRSMGDVHARGNPHIQTDPRNIAKVAAEMVERLKQIDGQNSSTYQQRYDDFQARWKAAIGDWVQQAATLRGMPVVVYHRSWIYLQDWLGLREVAALEPKPGIPPNSGHLADVLDRAAKEGVKAVIYGQYQDAKSVEWFSKRSAVPAVLLPTTVGGTAAADNLFHWFDDIIRRLQAAQGTNR